MDEKVNIGSHVRLIDGRNAEVIDLYYKGEEDDLQYLAHVRFDNGFNLMHVPVKNMKVLS